AASGERGGGVASAIAEHARDIVHGKRPAAVDAEDGPRAERRRHAVRAARVRRTGLVQRQREEHETGGAARDDPARHEFERLTAVEIARLDVVAELAGEPPGQVSDRAAGRLPPPAEQHGRRDLGAPGDRPGVAPARHAPAVSRPCLMWAARPAALAVMVALARRSDKCLLTTPPVLAIWGTS